MDLCFYPRIEIEAMIYAICNGYFSRDVRCIPCYDTSGEIYIGPLSSLKINGMAILETGNIFSNYIGPTYYYDDEKNFVNIRIDDEVSIFYAKFLINDKEIKHENNLPLIISPFDEFINLYTKDISAKNKIDLFHKWDKISDGLPMPLYVATISEEYITNKNHFENMLRKSIKFFHENIDIILKEIRGQQNLSRHNIEKMALLNFVNKSTFKISNDEYQAIELVRKYL